MFFIFLTENIFIKRKRNLALILITINMFICRDIADDEAECFIDLRSWVRTEDEIKRKRKSVLNQY